MRAVVSEKFRIDLETNWRVYLFFFLIFAANIVTIICATVGLVKQCRRQEEFDRMSEDYWTPERSKAVWLSNVHFNPSSMTARMPNCIYTPQILAAFLAEHPDLEVTSATDCVESQWLYMPQNCRNEFYAHNHGAFSIAANKDPTRSYAVHLRPTRYYSPTKLYTFRRK